MDTGQLLSLFGEVTEAITSEVKGIEDRNLAGDRPGQYGLDLVADGAALSLLLDAGVGVVSEESGTHHLDRPITVVLDPVDGSTNAAHGIPWYATSLCALDADGPLVAMVTNLVTRQRFSAVRGEGATVDGAGAGASGVADLDDAIVAVNDLPPRLGWRQYRSLGATALDLAAVACGMVDGYVDCSRTGVAPWDYLGALLVCREAGVVVEDLEGRPLVVTDHSARRRPVAGSGPLVAQLRERIGSA